MLSVIVCDSAYRLFSRSSPAPEDEGKRGWSRDANGDVESEEARETCRDADDCVMMRPWKGNQIICGDYTVVTKDETKIPNKKNTVVFLKTKEQGFSV